MRTPDTRTARRLARRVLTLLAAVAMAVIFGAWGIISCGSAKGPGGSAPGSCNPYSPDDVTCTAGHDVRATHGAYVTYLWSWGDPLGVRVFDVADQRAWFDWGYNRTTRNIRWINRNGQGRCLTPVGTCTIRYGTWPTAQCDRSGPDTCLFRRESDADVSFTYGIVFHRHLISCVAARLNWDGSFNWNAWPDDCTNPPAQATNRGNVRSQKLILGQGKNAVRVDQYLTRRAITALDRACISKDASRSECRDKALGLYRGLPRDVKRRLVPEGFAASTRPQAPVR